MHWSRHQEYRKKEDCIFCMCLESTRTNA
jgi:hypothetical protein